MITFFLGQNISLKILLPNKFILCPSLNTGYMFDILLPNFLLWSSTSIPNLVVSLLLYDKTALEKL